LWDWANKQQLKPEELGDVYFLGDTSVKTVRHVAAESGKVDILEKL
jgi:hypothetical protein